MAVDVSASVDRFEYQLQLKGIAEAFRNPRVTSTIERLGGNGIAVAMILWSQNYNIKLVVPFTHIYDRHTAMKFGERVGRVSRGGLSGYTALGGAIRRATELLQENQFDGTRRTIDISGDGRNNTRPALGVPRQHALALGITVNGLAIESDDARLTNYYFRNVIVGAGSFVETAADYGDFAAAMLRKLVREITPPITKRHRPAGGRMLHACAACIRRGNERQIAD